MWHHQDENLVCIIMKTECVCLHAWISILIVWGISPIFSVHVRPDVRVLDLYVWIFLWELGKIKSTIHNWWMRYHRDPSSSQVYVALRPHGVSEVLFIAIHTPKQRLPRVLWGLKDRYRYRICRVPVIHFPHPCRVDHAYAAWTQEGSWKYGWI